MTYLFYLGHPAHFHNVSVLTDQLAQAGQRVLLVARDKDVLFELLSQTDHEVIRLTGDKKPGKLGLIRFILGRERQIFKIARKYQPNVMIGTDLVITHIGKLLSIPSIVINEDDAEAVPLFARLGMNYATWNLVPECCSTGPYESTTIRYPGYQELAYLHPDHFTPDRVRISQLSPNGEDYFILRFSSLNAHHDSGVQGIDDAKALQLIELLAPHGKVFITSERPLSDSLEPYRIQVAVHDIHHALAFAKMYIGDSQTMTAEAAVLGTPALRFNDFVRRLSYLEELEFKYDLTYGFKTTEWDALVAKCQELLEIPDLKVKFEERQRAMLANNINVVDFWKWLLSKRVKDYRRTAYKDYLEINAR